MTAPRGERDALRTYVLPVLLAVVLLIPGCKGCGTTPVEEAGAEVAETADAEPASPATDKKQEDEKKEQEAPAGTPIPRSRVEVYFPSALGNGLVGESREIFATSTPGDRAKQIIADLISGPTSPKALRALPPDVRLRQAYVLDNGIAYLDFNAALTESVGGGSMEELLVVYSIVDSVVLNIDEIKRVGILVDGQPIATLNGHVDLRHPLPPDSKLILGSIVVLLLQPVGASRG